ncbi:MAG: hypothetical protein ACI4PH_04095 [Faecousia sp.]
MIETEIVNGKAKLAAFSKVYGKFITTLVSAINYCSIRKNSSVSLTKVGKAAVARINELFAEHEMFSKIPEYVDMDELEGSLCYLWSCTFLYPKLSMEWHAVYSEMNVLLESLLDGEWFA